MGPPVTNDNVTKLLSTAWRSSPKPNITNEVRFGFNFGPALFLTNETFPSAIYGGLIYGNPVNTFRAQGRFTNTYNFADNANWVKGKHSLSFGYQLQREYTSPYNDAGITPTLTLGMSPANSKTLSATQIPGASTSDVNAANNLLSNLAGYITSYTQTYNVTSRNSGFVNGATNSRNWNFDTHSFYLQDNFRVMPRLTLNLGVRYEYYSTVKERDGPRAAPGGQRQRHRHPAESGLHAGFCERRIAPAVQHDLNNFGPNIGFAWDVFGDGRTAIRGGYSVNFVNDEFLSSITGNANTNAGLGQNVTGQGLAAQVATPPTITPPTFKVPRTFGDNYALSRTTNFGIADPNLRTPYVQQWTIGVQREMKGIMLEARYVGNHGTKLLRALDYNQINLNAGGFLADFNRAYNNGNLALKANGSFNPAYNANIAGSQPLTVLPTLPSGQCNPTAAANVTTIQQGSAADYAWNCQSTATTAMPFSFFANPNAASLRMLTNYANSTFNSFQFELRAREKKGLTFQGNYNYSKVLSDAVSGNDNNNQGRYEPMMDNANPGLERSRAPFDLTHVFKFNYVYRFPMGNGHKFGWKPINKVVLDGWQMSGIFTRQSGQPYSVFSGRGTFNRQSNMQTQQGNTVNTTLTMDQLRDVMSFRMSGSGPYMVTTSALGSDGRAVARRRGGDVLGTGVHDAGSGNDRDPRPAHLRRPVGHDVQFRPAEADAHHRAQHARPPDGRNQLLQPSDVPHWRPDGDLDHLREDHGDLRRRAGLPVLDAVSVLAALTGAPGLPPRPFPKTHPSPQPQVPSPQVIMAAKRSFPRVQSHYPQVFPRRRHSRRRDSRLGRQ